ncbi:MAG: Fic family protein [Pyrinomonadaceae bacterium]
MRKRSKKSKFEALIRSLLEDNPEVSIRSIAEAAGVPPDETERRAIRRALKSLVEQDLIIAQGNARSRVYVLRKDVQEDEGNSHGISKATDSNKGVIEVPGIKLSKESMNLLRYVTQPLEVRQPIGYIQNFIRTYEPDQSNYLTPEEREKLKQVGQVEAEVRPAGTYARKILDRLLIDLSWNSSRLEGNTYSLLETKRLIELGEAAEGKDIVEAQMILNHKSAIEYIVDIVEEDQITSHQICSIHALLSENLLGDSSASGRLRSVVVGIGGSSYLPLENPHLIRECLDLFVEKVNQIDDPFEQSLFSLVHLSYLQAFEDVNKRTARLVANIPLLKKNLKPLSFVEVDSRIYVNALLGIYEKNDTSLLRDLFIWAYNRSSQKYTAIQQAIGEPNPLKLRYRKEIQEIVRSVILEKTSGEFVVDRIRELVDLGGFEIDHRDQIFGLIEDEFVSLHEGNIARFRIRPSEYQEWKELQ